MRQYYAVRFVACVVMVMMSAPLAHAAEATIGVVDVARIRQEYTKLVEERDKAQEMFKLEQQELDDRYDALTSRKQKLVTRYKNKELSEEAWEQEKNKIKLEEMELVQQREQKQKNWDQYVESKLEPLLKKIHEAIQQVGADGGFSVVFNSKDVEYWSPKVDVTDKVLKILNSKSGSSN